jgi:uncharacterized protein
MSASTALAIFGAGLAAGTVNTIVGAGSLITFPTLLAVGYPAVTANVTNTVGLVPGVVSGSLGYRRELVGQRRRLAVLGVPALAGGLTGGILLLELPGSVFRSIVPVLILIACGLILIQPALSRRLAARRSSEDHHGGAGLIGTVFATGVYGGYFGAAQGVLLIAFLAIFLSDDLQRLNGAKNVLAMLVNGVAALLFIAVAHVAWAAAGILAAGSILGGQVGATVGRRLSASVMRAAVVIVGVSVAIVLLV